MEQESGDADEWRTIDAVETACRILSHLETVETAGVTELADVVDRSPSAVHAHLATLRRHELVARAGRRYRLSTRLLGTAEHAKSFVGNYAVVREQVDELAAETGEVVQFGVEEHGRVLYVYKARGSDAVETASAIGDWQPVHSTGLGKAILAALPAERVEEVLDRRGLDRRTENTITDRDALAAELERIRERGYAVDDEENVRGVRCIATPVDTDTDLTTGAISVTGPASRMHDERLTGELRDDLERAANVVEVNSKYA